MHQDLKEETYELIQKHCLQASIPWSQVEGVVGAADDIAAKLLPDNWPV